MWNPGEQGCARVPVFRSERIGVAPFGATTNDGYAGAAVEACCWVSAGSQSIILDIPAKPAAGGLNANQTDLVGSTDVVGSSEWNDVEHRAVARADL
jgi:hypothetical protein